MVKNPRVIALFDVDGTLTPARKVRPTSRSLSLLLSMRRCAGRSCFAHSRCAIARLSSHCVALQDVSPEMVARLQKLRQQITIGVVGGSDLVKQKEQLGETGASIARASAHTQSH